MSVSENSSAAIVRAIALTKQIQTGAARLDILTDVSFDIARGEAVAIIGASGSGKSTLLGLLAGLDTPSAGQVLLDGVDIFTLDEDDRAELRGQLIGFVFQSFQLLTYLTALENVMLPLEIAGAAPTRKQAQEMLARVGLAERFTHHPNQLSGGEQQRVAIARAFICAPKLLLADEPTGNLDAVTGAQIIDLMFELNRERGTTLILVTHNESLSRRCGRQLRLVAGRLQPQDAQ